MKLRIRSSETRETIRLEISSSSTISDLKALIAGRLISSPAISVDDVHLSLNRKDELVGAIPEETLETLGIASGDLIFYTLDPSSFTQPSSTSPSPILSAAAPIDGLESPPQSKSDERGKNLMAESEGQGFPKSVMESVHGTEEKRTDAMNFLVIAMHAVFLESGFNESSFSKGFSTVSISYSLPEIHDAVELKFLLMGKFLDVYGHVVGGDGSNLRRLCVDASKFNPEDEEANFDIWRSVKDKLFLPLFMEICSKNGLPSPPCFIYLPTELKIKIMELVGGVDLARAACVSSELRYLCSNEDLWKKKFAEEFPGREAYGSRGNFGSRWKDKFAAYWEDRKRIERHRSVSTIYQHAVPLLRPRDRSPFPGNLPNVLGGDYDRFPAFGGLFFGGSRRARSPFLRGQRSVPRCNLGGFYA
ncbi:F-box protein SKIP22-like [Wolffia australiana]